MPKPHYTITVRKNDSKAGTTHRFENVIQERYPDFEFPFDAQGPMKDLLKSMQSYAKEAYDIVLQLIGYCPPEHGAEEWTFEVRFPHTDGHSAQQVEYEVL